MKLLPDNTWIHDAMDWVVKNREPILRVWAQSIDPDHTIGLLPMWNEIVLRMQKNRDGVVRDMRVVRAFEANANDAMRDFVRRLGLTLPRDLNAKVTETILLAEKAQQEAVRLWENVRDAEKAIAESPYIEDEEREIARRGVESATNQILRLTSVSTEPK